MEEGKNLKLLIKDDYESMSDEVADLVRQAISEKPDLVLGLATGSTPKGMYKRLVNMHRDEKLDFSKLTSFNLDEYVGIDSKNPSSYCYYMHKYFFDHINIKEENIFIPPSNPVDIDQACIEYDELIEAKGGIDLQILGIGENGHIAFNEPDEYLSLGTNVVELTDETIEVNSRFFDSIEEVPKTAITMGIGSIMRAKKIILLANGKNKAAIMKKLLDEKKISTEIPASILFLHPDITFILTKDVMEK